MTYVFYAPFIQGPFDPPSTEITAATTDLTGGTAGTAILTAEATDGCLFEGIHFKAQQALQAGKILIFHYTGSVRELIGEMMVPELIDAPSATTPAWEDTWFDPRYRATGKPRFLPASDEIQCAWYGASAKKITATPLGGQL